MNVIQIILIMGLVGLGLLVTARLQTSFVMKPLMVLFTVVGIYFVLYPDRTTQIAHWLGVDRGADLMFYLFMLLVSFLLTHLYARQRELKAQLTQLYREDALRRAEQLGGPEPGGTPKPPEEI